MRHLLASPTTLALLGGSGSAVAAQEEAEPPPAGTFDTAGPLALPRTGRGATLLPDGLVLVTGGEGLDPRASDRPRSGTRRHPPSAKGVPVA